jgi:hypothetical protein
MYSLFHRDSDDEQEGRAYMREVLLITLAKISDYSITAADALEFMDGNVRGTIEMIGSVLQNYAENSRSKLVLTYVFLLYFWNDTIIA